MTPERVLSTYYRIAGLHTLAASLVWAIHVLFLLDAGLDILEVFVANATTTATIALFEIPTGVLADVRGRRTSLLLSVAALGVATSIYLAAARTGAPLGAFCLGALALGLGATFYSGAVEAWLVDSLERSGHRGPLDAVLARGQVVTGATSLLGTVAGGLLATLDLAWPYLLRLVLLAVLFGFALLRMEEPELPRRRSSLAAEVRRVARSSVAYGWRKPTVRGLIAAGLIQYGFLLWAFHAWQPYFLELLGRDAPWVAGGVGALITLATMAGNALVERATRSPRPRTPMLLVASVLLTATAVGIGLTGSFAWALVLILLMSAAWGVVAPVRQAWLHRLIPSQQRATVMSFDSLLGNAGGALGQSGLGYFARTWGVAGGYVTGGLVTVLAWPVLLVLGRLDCSKVTAAARGVLR